MIRLVKSRRGLHVCETKPRYDVLFNGKLFDQLWFNMTGYVGYLPCPEGGRLTIGECSISEYRREVAKLNREFKSIRT